jgi:predicted GH43/DUF377 family glycosyl hydrolase
MTIETNVSKAQFIGSGSVGPFTFDFRFFSNGEIFVIKTSTTGEETLFSEGADYTLTGAGSHAGGIVTLTVALAASEGLTVFRIVDLLQSTSIRNQGAFFPEIHENVFDKMLMMIQQINDKARRAIKLSESVPGDCVLPSSDRAGMIPGWNSSRELVYLPYNPLFTSSGSNYPWVDSRGYGSLAAAVSAIGGAVTTLLVADARAVSADLTIPNNISLFVANGGLINVSAGKYLAINGAFIAGEYQVFNGDGSVTFAYDSIRDYSPKWFGKSSDGKRKWNNNFDNVDNGYSLQKISQVLVPGAYPYMDTIVESPMIWWDSDQKYHMIFTAYSDATGTMIGTHGHATSLDLVTWIPDTTAFFTASGTAGAPDEKGVTGPYLVKQDDIYYLYYIGMTEEGYETGTKSLCLATSSSLSGPWTRHGAIIPLGTIGTSSAWRHDAIYHPSIVEKNGMYYMFFNASGLVGGVTRERIGYATSNNLLDWIVDDVNSPIVDGVDGSWHDGISGDPSVYHDGSKWVMHFFGTGGTASDGIAITTDADFPLNWQIASFNPVLVTTPNGYDSMYAHKPFIYFSSGKLYHFYTAVSLETSIRCIALAVSTQNENKYVYSTDELVKEIRVPDNAFTVVQRVSSRLSPVIDQVYDTYVGKLKWERQAANGFAAAKLLEFDSSSTGGIRMYGENDDTQINTVVSGNTSINILAKNRDIVVKGAGVIMGSNNYNDGTYDRFSSAATAYQLRLTSPGGLKLYTSTNTPVNAAVISWDSGRAI